MDLLRKIYHWQQKWRFWILDPPYARCLPPLKQQNFSSFLSITLLPLNFNNTKIMQSNISHNPLSHPILFLKRRIQACSWRRVFHQVQKYILSLLSTSILP